MIELIELMERLGKLNNLKKEIESNKDSDTLYNRKRMKSAYYDNRFDTKMRMWMKQLDEFIREESKNGQTTGNDV